MAKLCKGYYQFEYRGIIYTVSHMIRTTGNWGQSISRTEHRTKRDAKEAAMRGIDDFLLKELNAPLPRVGTQRSPFAPGS